MQTLNRGVCAADAEHPACQVDEGQIKKFLAGTGILCPPHFQIASGATGYK